MRSIMILALSLGTAFAAPMLSTQSHKGVVSVSNTHAVTATPVGSGFKLEGQKLSVDRPTWHTMSSEEQGTRIREEFEKTPSEHRVYAETEPGTLNQYSTNSFSAERGGT